MNLFLTGGAGYVGSACLRRLLKHGHEAIAYDNLSEGNRSAVPSSRLVVGDLSDVDAMVAAMRINKIDAVMHFAAAASVPESIKDPEFYYRTNVLGTKNVLDAMRHAGVRRIIFSSTAATYGFHARMPMNEDTQQAPVVPYGTSKLAAEWLIKDYAHAYGMGYTIFRYFNASGSDADGQHGEDRRCESHLIPLTLSVATGRKPKLLIYGDDYETRDGTCVRDYVHVDDIAQAHQLAVESLEPGMGRAYNLGSGTGVTVLEVLRACEEEVGFPISHEIVDRRPGDPGVLIASPRRAIQQLGWEPTYTNIRHIVATAWRWHCNHPNGYGSAPSSTLVLPPAAVRDNAHGLLPELCEKA
jgi:UDP-glucose 4-epimerase